MKQKTKIKAVIFDIGGVMELGKYDKLSKGHRTLGVHEYVAKKLKIKLDQWFDSIDTPYALAIEGKITKKKALDIISKNVKVSPRKLEKILKKAYRKYFKTNKKLYKFAYALKKNGYKIAILSDQWYVSEEVVIPKKRMKKFDVVIVSCRVGVRKPNPEIYKLTLKKLKLKPQETVFIDNQIWNIKPAKKLKMKAILYKDNEQTIKELNKLGVKF